jgi:hypothetical protein
LIRSEQVYWNHRIKPTKPGWVGSERWPAALATGVDNPASKDVEGVGDLKLSLDRRSVGGTKPAHDDVRVYREVVEEHGGVRSQNLNFGDGQGWHKVGEATDTGGTQPRAERDTTAGPRGDSACIEDFSPDRQLKLAQQASAIR